MRVAISVLIFILFYSIVFAVEKSQIDTATRHFFKGKLPIISEKLQISVKNYPKAILSLPDGVEIFVEGDISPKLRKRVPLRLYAIDTDGTQISSYMTALLTLEKEVVCAGGLIKKGELLTAENCKTSKADIIEYPGKPVFVLSQLSGRRAKKNINRGEVIDFRATEAMPMVLRGEKVKIVACVGNLKVEADGIAREDGSPGDLIRVRNSSSGKTISGLVAAKGIVEVTSLK